MDERNLKAKASGGSAIHGITKYADVSPDEFTRLLGYRAGSAAASSDNDRSQVVNKMVAQTSIRDWTGIYTSAVKGLIELLLFRSIIMSLYVLSVHRPRLLWKLLGSFSR